MTGGANGYWGIRPMRELNNELSALYRLPVDAARKANALQLIATALNHDDLAMAAIATVQMQFPDPPWLAKGAETCEEMARRAAELCRSGLLKFWDPAKHPRVGTPPNPGWFAPVGEESEASNIVPAAMARPPRGTGFSPFDWQPFIVEGGGGGGVPRGQLELPFSFPRFWSRPTITEIPAKPPSPPPRPLTRPESQPALPFPEGLPTQRESSGMGESTFSEIPVRGGRLGNSATRAQNAAEAAKLTAEGLDVTNGDDAGPEEYFSGEGPGTRGGTFVDITAVDPKTGKYVRVQTVDTEPDGETPTPREQAAIDRIRARFPNDELRIIPKRKQP